MAEPRNVRDNGDDNREDNRDDSRDNNGEDNGPGAITMVLAGIGIGAAALYGVSKWFGSGSSDEKKPSLTHSNVVRTNRVSKKDQPYLIEVIEMKDKCMQAVNDIESDCEDYPVVGLDCKWTNDWSGNHEKVAVLSICTPNRYCVLFCLREWDSIPTSLKTFLNDESIIKVGLGIDIDQNKLKNDYNLSLRGTVDLRFIAKENGYPTRRLPYLAKVIANITLDENCDDTQWNDHPLPQNYIDYTTMHAYASIEIIKKLAPSKGRVENQCSKFIDKRFTSNMNNF